MSAPLNMERSLEKPKQMIPAIPAAKGAASSLYTAAALDSSSLSAPSGALYLFTYLDGLEQAINLADAVRFESHVRTAPFVDASTDDCLASLCHHR